MKKLINLFLCFAIVLGISLALPRTTTVKADTEQTYLRCVESDAEGWTWNGFMQVENDKASKFWEHGTFNAQSFGTYTFKGNYLEVFGYVGTAGGKISITLDEEDLGEFSLYAEKDTYKESIVKLDLYDGYHTVKITALEQDKWHAIDYIKVNLDKEVYEQNYNLALVGDIICSVPSPTGGGNKDLNVIRNEIIYPVGTQNLGPAQYDSFNGSGRGYFYMGYEYKEEITFSRLVFQEGDTWVDGGWFSDGDIKVQVRSNGAWKDVELLESVNYPSSDKREDFGQSCEIFDFKFNPIKGTAIRLIGMNGGQSNFVSVSQIEVYGNLKVQTLSNGYDYKKATVYEYDNSGNETESNSNTDVTSSGNQSSGGCGSSFGGDYGILFATVTLAIMFMYKKIREKKYEAN